jgi:hypothetical protein
VDSIFIKHNVPSSKNGKIKGMFFSKTVQRYLKSYGIQSFSSSKKEVRGYVRTPITFPVDELKALFKDKEYPIIIGFHFIRDSKRRWDFINIVQILLDLFTAFDIIEDDNMDCVIPMPFKIDNAWYSYDKENPGVIITIL